MKLSGKPINNIDIAEYYAINIRPMWDGFKLEGAAFKWLCFYLFLEYVRPQVRYPALDILPWGQLALLTACVLAVADPTVKWVRSPGNALLILYFTIVLLSAVFAFDSSYAFSKIDIIANWLLVYFLMITVVNTEKRLITFLLVFFLANFKMSQFGFRSFITSGYSSWGVSGSPGWFQNAGDLGVEMTIFVALSAGFVLALRQFWGKFKKLLFYLMPVTGLVTIIATASRGAQLGIAAAMVWFLLKSRLGFKALLVSLILGASIYAILPQEMFDEFSDAGEDATSVIRLSLWDFGMEVVREKPVFGIGYENWMNYCWFKNPNGIEDSGQCFVQHNTMLEAASETGVTGFLIYVSILLFIIFANARTRVNAKQCHNKFLLYIAHGLDGGLIAYLVSSFFISVLFYPMIWVQLAMTVALNQISRKQAGELKAKSKSISKPVPGSYGHILE